MINLVCIYIRKRVKLLPVQFMFVMDEMSDLYKVKVQLSFLPENGLGVGEYGLMRVL